MIRFLPDTWPDALFRPIAMAAPDAGVYVEIMAPDTRFVVILALALILVAINSRQKWRLSPVLLLLAFVSAAFAIWLMTSGNGRYFIPVLLVAGPLCIGLVSRLPATATFRLAIAIGVIGVQALVIYQNNPWHWWGLAPWNTEPFFALTLDDEALSKPATYVGVTSISYSLVAPRFPVSSRWVNISSQPDPEKTAEGRRLQSLLESSKLLMLFIPSVPKHMTSEGYPDAEITLVINGMLGKQHLALDEIRKCRVLPSKGLASQVYRNVSSINATSIAKIGFWVCPLKRSVKSPALDENEESSTFDRIFEIVEKTCPRFFPPNEVSTSRVEDGFVRNYSSADMKLYVLDDGKILYKYWRALNPMFIGTISSVQAGGFQMDCNTIRGRSGLPWDRQL